MQYTRESWLQAKTYINISLPLMSILFTWLIIHVHKLFYTGIQSQAILNCAPLILQFEPICSVHVYCAYMMFSSEFQQAVRSNKVKVSLSAMMQKNKTISSLPLQFNLLKINSLIILHDYLFN